MIPVKVENRHGPSHKAVTQLPDAIQAGCPGNPAQPGLGVSGEVRELGAELPATDVDNHMSLVPVTSTLSEHLI